MGIFYPDLKPRLWYLVVNSLNSLNKQVKYQIERLVKYGAFVQHRLIKHGIEMKKIDPSQLIPMNLFENTAPIRINLAYSIDEAPNIFGEIYHKNALLWLHEDLASIIVLAAYKCFENTGLNFVLYDGLRTIEAQAKMSEAPIVKANPSWLEPPRLLSPPGAGAHPRGMAIDVSLMDKRGALIDMGTVFDHLSPQSSAEFNPAHRQYVQLSAEAKSNRALLDHSMLEAAEELNLELLPLPQEWWDYRMPENIYKQYAPLSDQDLPPEMRMVETLAETDIPSVYAPQIEGILERVKPYI